MRMNGKEPSTWMDTYAHLPVEDNTPDEPQGQLVISIYNICPSYINQINLKGTQKRTFDPCKNNIACKNWNLVYWFKKLLNVP